jgi:hypothetical protein
MLIESRLLPAEAGLSAVAMTTLYGDKTLFVGLGQGQCPNGLIEMTETSEACLARLTEHARLSRPDGAMIVAAIGESRQVSGRIAETFARANDGDLVFFVCEDGPTYDFAFVKLNVGAAGGWLQTH